MVAPPGVTVPVSVAVVGIDPLAEPVATVGAVVAATACVVRVLLDPPVGCEPVPPLPPEVAEADAALDDGAMQFSRWSAASWACACSSVASSSLSVCCAERS